MSDNTPTGSRAAHNLEQQALAQANAGHYKEAIALYKKLLQQGDNDAWYRQLAHCYLQRAKSFAARGMIQEALALWENYTQYAQPPYQDYDHYMLWLILSGNQSKIETALRQLTARQLDKDYPKLSAVLGLLILARHPQWHECLPQDSALHAHLGIAQEALKAEDMKSVREAMQALPYRSALRDLRALVNACHKASHSLADIPPSLDKIPPHSPYAAVAALIRLCALSGAQLAEEMSKLSSHQRRLIGAILSLDKQRQKLVDTLSMQQGKLSDKVKFNLAIQFQSLFGAELAQRFCIVLLNDYPAGLKDYKKNFGALDEFENHRLKALRLEQQHRYQEAEFHWRQCIQQLTHQDGDNAVKIALILRHLAKHQENPEQTTQLLSESLDYDPNDKDSLLQILRFYGQSNETAGPYKQWLQQAEAKFPQDVELLTLVVESAIRNQTYKKAVQYARKILQIDPLNSFAKKTVLSGHLNHARKQLKNKKYQLAAKEIQQAEALRAGKNQNLQSQLLRALLIFTSEDKAQGLKRLKDTLATMHRDPLNMHFQAATEAQLCGLPVATLLRALPPANGYLLSKTELSLLLQQLSEYGLESGRQELLCKALDKIKAPLKKSLTHLAKEDTLLLSLCETLYKLEHFELMRHCVKSVAISRKKPIWIYYQVYAETGGDPARCNYTQLHSLRLNHELAIQDKDQRARVLIEQYLDRYDEAHRMPAMDQLYDLIEQNMADDPIEQLFAHVPESIMIKIDQKLEKLLTKISPERLFRDLSKSVGNDSNVLVAIMNNPDLFTALMMLRAADELGFDVNISVADVLDYFDAQQSSTPSFPFPF